MTRCLITPGDSAIDEPRWLSHIARWIESGVDFVQIRERARTSRDLAGLTRKVIGIRGKAATKILVNDRADVAIACAADGVHLRDGSVDPKLFRRPGRIVSVAVHAPEQVQNLEADLFILSPIFIPLSKNTHTRPLGLAALTAAKALSNVPILALGGVTAANETQCLKAGAAGIAGISYFA